MGLFSGLKGAFKNVDMNKLSNGIGMARATLDDDPEGQDHYRRLMMLQRQQQQAPQIMHSQPMPSQQTMQAYGGQPNLQQYLPQQFAPLGSSLPPYLRGIY